MKHSRPFRLVTACIALLSMLFMQFALASYVCPGQMTSVTMTAADASSAQSIPGCEGADKNQAGLCHAFAHDHQAKQSLDKPDVPAVQPFMAVGLVLALTLVDTDHGLTTDFSQSSRLQRSSAPPIAIRHCCFRI